jgi:hypothetical protein
MTTLDPLTGTPADGEDAAVGPRTRVRRYSRRRLDGPVTVTFSARVRYPKFHITDECEALEATPEEARDIVTFDSAMDLGLSSEGRPCRICTLESVLVTVLDPRRRHDEQRDGAKVFLSFTSQANPSNPDSDIVNYSWAKATASGQARLRRVARRTRLATTVTSSGIVAYGLVSEAAADVVAKNLRSVIRHAAAVPGGEVLECLWALLNDDPPELAAYLGSAPNIDAWETARALLS